MRSTLFINETDFSRKLIHYTYTERCLTSSTIFVTIQIVNFYTMVSHKHMTKILGYFLQDNLPENKLEKISIITIQNLMQLFLYNNIFHYKGKIFTCAKGSPNTMALTDTLADIYLFEWQKLILKEIGVKRELFGRHVLYHRNRS